MIISYHSFARVWYSADQIFGFGLLHVFPLPPCSLSLESPLGTISQSLNSGSLPPNIRHCKSLFFTAQGMPTLQEVNFTPPSAPFVHLKLRTNNVPTATPSFGAGRTLSPSSTFLALHEDCWRTLIPPQPITPIALPLLRCIRTSPRSLTQCFHPPCLLMQRSKYRVSH